jgi:hypothetical protein
MIHIIDLISLVLYLSKIEWNFYFRVNIFLKSNYRYQYRRN